MHACVASHGSLLAGPSRGRNPLAHRLPHGAAGVRCLHAASSASPQPQGGRLVSGIETDAVGNVVALVARDTATGQEERLEADAVVFAISIAGRSPVQAQPATWELRPDFAGDPRALDA